MNAYNHKKIEARWQEEWEKKEVYKTTKDPTKPKCYVLDMFPYPSGEGLHVGHPKGYIASDIYTRYKHMNGYSVLHPMGWDAFGLPAEQFAIKNKVHPRMAVQKNTERYKAQLAKIGFTYDWTREINTTDPEYYRWTQWIFLQLYKKGLAFESFEPINWCPSCQTGLANEDLDGANCERCGTAVVKKPMRQWVLKITDYADRLLADLDALEWPESIKESQRNWIGRSEGAVIDFPLAGIEGQEDGAHKVTVFTTRPDTLFGATFLAISPEVAQKWLDVGWKASAPVCDYIADTLARRAETTYKDNPEKTGVDAGITALNPATQQKIPVWIVNYVLGDVGTGAIMAVPAHDERDAEFAKKYNLPSISVVDVVGALENSGQFDGMATDEAKKAITAFVGGKEKTTYKLKDWVFSRQRYWGEPIPIIHCAQCGSVPVPEAQLPVKLPEVESYAPTGTGESPLADIPEWVNVPCPTCGGAGKRETNTMPQWAGSSWYYLRFIDPHNKEALVDKAKEKYWSPVDMYVGGAEHATRHLIYARFWHKFLYDIGAVNYLEPFKRLQHVGLIMADDGRKMSKRYGNVINPDDVVATFGADSLRIYEMFMGPFDQSIAWSTQNIMGARRFIERVWKLQEKVSSDDSAEEKEVEQLLHQTIKKVGGDIERFGFNTAIAQLMILLNMLEKKEYITLITYRTFIVLIAPFAPHIAEELWSIYEGKGAMVYHTPWPHYDEAKTESQTMTIAIQVNGKLRDTLALSRDTTETEVKSIAVTRPLVAKWLEGKEPKKVIYISGKILNIVV